MSSKRVKNPEQVKDRIREYYRDADLWLPSNPSWRVYRLQTISDDGELNFFRLRDRVDTKEKLRQHLIEHTPLNVYFSVSCWMNPSKTAHKTYNKDWDGREHIDKNHFLFSDVVIDCDHLDKDEVKRIYRYILENKNISEDEMYYVFSGGGYHINLEKYYTNKSVCNPIEREKKFHSFLQKFAQELINEGLEFDYMKQRVKTDDGEKKIINSPTTDTRRVRKLPGTVTKYGNRSEVVENLDDFSPEQVMEKPELTSKKRNLQEFRGRVKALCH